MHFSSMFSHGCQTAIGTSLYTLTYHVSDAARRDSWLCHKFSNLPLLLFCPALPSSSGYQMGEIAKPRLLLGLGGELLGMAIVSFKDVGLCALRLLLQCYPNSKSSRAGMGRTIPVLLLCTCHSPDYSFTISPVRSY